MIHRGICLWSHFLPFFALFTLTRADYFIDNTNSSIIYTPLTGAIWAWENLNPNTAVQIIFMDDGSPSTIDYTRVYNETV